MTFDQFLAKYGDLIAAQPGVPAQAATDPSFFGLALLHIMQTASDVLHSALGGAYVDISRAIELASPTAGHTGPSQAEYLDSAARYLADAVPHLR